LGGFIFVLHIAAGGEDEKHFAWIACGAQFFQTELDGVNGVVRFVSRFASQQYFDMLFKPGEIVVVVLRDLGLSLNSSRKYS
jgi:hypothetical protein